MTDTDKGRGVDPALGQALEALTPGTLDEATDAGPWHHTAKTWKDGQAGGTPITAQALNQLDAELATIFASTPSYTVASALDKVPSSPSVVHVVDHEGRYQGTWLDTPSGRLPVYQPSPVVMNVGPITFRRIGRIVSAEMFWVPLGVDVHSTSGIVSLGTLPEGWRPMGTATGLLLSDGPLMPVANLAIGGDGNLTTRYGGQDLTAGMRLSLTTVTYMAA